MSYEKHDIHRFFIFKKRTVAVYTGLESLHVNKFASYLAHTHIIFPLTLSLIEKLMIISPEDTF